MILQVCSKVFVTKWPSNIYCWPILGSFLLINLTIFSLCLQITKDIARSEITKNGKEMFVALKLKYIIKGKANAALTLASDTILNNDIII